MKFKPLPEFKSYTEEADFWDNTSVGKDFNYPKSVKAYKKKTATRDTYITVRLDKKLKDSISRFADSKDISISSLMRMWATEKLSKPSA